MSEHGLIYLNQYSLESHVEDAIEFARQKAGSKPISAGDLLLSILNDPISESSDAFKKINSILNSLEKQDFWNKSSQTDNLDEINVSSGLFESYSIAQEIWGTDNPRIWGRDIITLALFAVNDSSLHEVVSQAGKSLDEVHIEWYKFVISEPSGHHSIETWTEWWKKAQIPIPESVDELTTAYLLLWNPDIFDEAEFRQLVKRVQNKDDSVIGWSSGNRKKMIAGERVYLLRKGRNQGLVGTGIVNGEVVVQKHFNSTKRASGKTYNMVPVQWEVLRVEPVVPIDVLKSETNETAIWKSQAGGVLIPKRIIPDLKNVWDKYVVDDSDKPPMLKLKAKMFSDRTIKYQEDLLGFKNYSLAISKIIKDNANGKPFNIGIIAPWGHGKTTLMEFIREELEPGYDSKEKREHTDRYKTKYKDLLAWLSNKKKGQLTFQSLNEYHPTIWFNAWKYQSSDQIWAGVGHAIITQLVEKLKPLEQEKFWFKLKYKQIDKDTLQRKIYRFVYQRLPMVLLSSILVLACIVLSFYLFGEESTFEGFLSVILGGGSAVWSFDNFKNIRNKFKTEIQGQFTEVIKSPDYSSKLGLYHQLTEDLQRVFDILINQEKPAVVFIDDLDRCSPDVMAEVFEAINLIMTNPSVGKNCFFIFGMDAQVVAATLDEKYKNLEGKLPGHEHTYGSVGWYFLDKFIQLPFNIPIVEQKEKKDFIKNFFESPGQKKFEEEPDSQIASKVENLKSAIDKDDKTEITTIIKEEENLITRHKLEQTFISAKITQYKEDSPEIVEQLDYLSKYLSSSPREIKRYINLLRFHNVHQELRSHLSSDAPNFREIAKWLLISIKWPQMIRWIQWENEKDLVTINTPRVKARKIDELFYDFLAKHTFKDEDDQSIVAQWHRYLKKNGAESLEWLNDNQLLKVFQDDRENEGALLKAVKSRVW